MSDWVVTLTYGVDLDQRRMDAVEDATGATVYATPGLGTSFVLRKMAPGPLKAAAAAEGAIVDALGPALVPVEVDVVSEELYDARADEPSLPELVSAPEVGEILGGISRQRVYQLQDNAGFPEPLFRLRTGPIWDARAIRAFASRWERKPGRPRLSGKA